MKRNVKVSAIQAAPALFDLKGTLEKVDHWLEKAKDDNPDLVLFPEAFIPAYPRGFTFGAPVGSRSEQGRELWNIYYQNSLSLQSEEFKTLSGIIRSRAIFTAIGVVEKDNGTLYCTLLYFNSEGNLVARHRKLKPTAAERIIWGEGDGSTLATLETPMGRIGGLICWENYMPLARMAMYAKGIQIYLAPTADHRNSWQTTMKHIAIEGRVFVIACNQYVTKSMYPTHLPLYEELNDLPEEMSKGGSVIISPFGEVLAGPLYGEEGIVSAQIDLEEIDRARMDFAPAGHYNRPDVFDFEIPDQPEMIKVK